MNDYHVVLGILTALLTFTAFGLYLRSMFREGTKPHPFTWLVFAIIDGTVFFAQVLNGGGPGAWPVGIGAMLAGVVFLFSLKHGEKRITKIDWTCLFIALIGIVAWTATNNAFIAVVLATVSDVIAKVPTFRKSFIRPHEESITIWLFDSVKFSLSIIALLSITWTTALFPAEIAVTNVLLVGMILFRRRQLAASGRTG